MPSTRRSVVAVDNLPLFNAVPPAAPVDGFAARYGSAGTIVSSSAAMQKVLAFAERVASVDSTVLITGESGVGKERLAQFIHRASPRRSGPFTAVNCGALPDALFEAELFGHTRGAFTGAIQDKAGLFEATHNGTLLLDEVGETPPSGQVKLLRTLQERQVRRLGEARERRVNVRVIAATNRSLARDVSDQRFRADLFYRLRVVELFIPPLRERPEDVKALLATVLARVANEMGRPVEGYTSEAYDRLLRYHWPGNVRELENAVERACALSVSDQIAVEDLPDEVVGNRSLSLPTRAIRPLHSVEREYIMAALQQNDGNKTKTAVELGIGTATLFRKLKRYSRQAHPSTCQQPKR